MRSHGNQTVLSRVVTDENGVPQFYRGRHGKYISIIPNRTMFIKDAPGTTLPYTMYHWETKEETQCGKYITEEEMKRLFQQSKTPPELIPASLVHSVQ